ncbi:MAG: hypothetical protein MI748_07385, partial [Opitutales bacterium]|nr:hypothetical protein [Opitutales bacterium]
VDVRMEGLILSRTVKTVMTVSGDQIVAGGAEVVAMDTESVMKAFKELASAIVSRTGIQQWIVPNACPASIRHKNVPIVKVETSARLASHARTTATITAAATTESWEQAASATRASIRQQVVPIARVIDLARVVDSCVLTLSAMVMADATVG